MLLQFGYRVKQVRLRRRLTQEAAAAKAGIGYKRWQEIEGGRANPTILTAWRIARGCGVPPGRLF